MDRPREQHHQEQPGTGDPTFMALCNARIRSVADDHVAETFGDLMDSMEKIHGPDRTAEMLPEYAAALAAAGRDDEASDAVTRYLALHEQGNQLSKTDTVRLDYAIDRLMQWGSSHSDLMNQLVSLRETGRTTASDASIENDEELKQDLDTLQGTWRYRGWKQGKLVETMVQRFEGTTSISRRIDEQGDQAWGRRGRIELTRSGGVKVMNVYLGAAITPTESFVYQVKPSRFSIVNGMLTNRTIPHDIEMRTWYRITEKEEENAQSE